MKLIMEKIVTILLVIFARTRANGACPKMCRCQGSMDTPYINCQDQRLKQVPMDLPKFIFELDLGNNQGIKIPLNHFENFTIDSLILTNNGQTTAFFLPQGLSSLILSYNELNYKDVTQMFHLRISTLLTLKLDHNNILFPNSSRSVFQNTPYLTTLYLAFNHIPYVNSQMFSNLTQLNRLYLMNCKIRAIAAKAFNDLNQLSELDLSCNMLKTLPGDIFHNNLMLTELWISSNFLEKFPLVNRRLYALDLSDNNFTYVDDICLLQVAVLMLGNNRIQRMPKTFLHHMLAIFELDLSWNELTRIGERVFPINRFLKIINLSNNRIVEIHPNAFTPLKGLQALYLSSNRIKRLPHGLIYGLNIRSILLHDNNMSTADNILSQNHGRVEVVTLFKNDIKLVTDELVTGLSKSTSLYLTCKNIALVNTSLQSVVNITCKTDSPVVIPKVSFTMSRSFRNQGFACPGTGPFQYTTCRSCKAGHYNKGAFSCSECARGGYYQDEVAQSNCKPCSPGRFVNHTAGSSTQDCQTCPQGTDTTRHANTRACYCLQDLCRVDRFGKCEESSDKGIQCLNDTARLKADYWWFWHNKSDEAKYLCFQKNMMVNDEYYNRSCMTFYGQLPRVYRCLFDGACTGGNEAKCHGNYTGPLCAVCITNYYQSHLGCLKCKSKAASALKLLTLPCFIVVILVISLWADKIQFDKSQERTLSDVFISCGKVFLAHYQLLAVVLRLLSAIQWPKMLVTLAIASYQVTMEVFSFPALKCLHPSLEVTAFQEMIIAVTTSVAVPCLIAIALSIHLCAIKRNKHTSYTDRADRLIGLYLRYLLIFLFVFYPFMCQRIFQVLPFACHKVCYDRDGRFCKDYLRVDYREQCASSDPSKSTFVTVSYIACILPIGFPLILLVMLRYSTKKIHEERDSYTEDSIICIATRFCYENYKPSCWYWEVVEMLRKLLFTVGFAFFGLDTRTSLGCMIIISGTFTVAYAYIKPIKYSGNHALQMVSLCSLLLTLSVGSALRVSKDQLVIHDEKADKLGISILLIAINSALFFALLCMGLYSAFRKVKKKYSLCNS